MNAKRILWAALVVPFMLAGCLLVPGPRAGRADVVPILPPLVVLDAEPYYVHDGYHYHYRNDGWYYAHARSGPWIALPRDHYPREVKYRDGGARKEGPRDVGRNPGHEGR